MTSPVDTSATDEASADKEFVAAEHAIAEAASYANSSQAAGDAGDDAKPIVREDLSPDQRRELSRRIAKRQRKLGEDELSRVYPGTIVIMRNVSVSDPNIASSATRFLGLVDRTLYLLNRFGLRYHSASEIETIRESVRSTVDAYCNEANNSLNQGRELSQQAQSKTMDWLEPSYTSKTLEISFGVKARDTISLINALETWDKAILEFAALEFNDTASIGQVDTLRQTERRLFMGISRMCLRTISGFSKRRNAMAQSKEKAASQDAPAAATEAELG